MMEAFPARDELMAEIRGLNRENRRAHVVSMLKSLAERSQRPVHDALADAEDEVRRVRVLWGVNGVALDATPRVIERLASLRGVRRVLLDRGRGRPAAPVVDAVWLRSGGSSPACGGKRHRADGG